MPDMKTALATGILCIIPGELLTGVAIIAYPIAISTLADLQTTAQTYTDQALPALTSEAQTTTDVANTLILWLHSHRRCNRSFHRVHSKLEPLSSVGNILFSLGAPLKKRLSRPEKHRLKHNQHKTTNLWLAQRSQLHKLSTKQPQKLLEPDKNYPDGNPKLSAHIC